MADSKIATPTLQERIRSEIDRLRARLCTNPESARMSRPDLNERLRTATQRAAELKQRAANLREEVRINRETLHELLAKRRQKRREHDAVLATGPMALRCPFCKAKPRHDCETSSAGFAVVHVARIKAATADKPALSG